MEIDDPDGGGEQQAIGRCNKLMTELTLTVHMDYNGFDDNTIISKDEDHMRTTLTIDDVLFQDLMDITQAGTKSEAVRTALKEYLLMKRKEKVLAMRGNVDIDDSWQELRQLEVDESQDRCYEKHPD